MAQVLRPLLIASVIAAALTAALVLWIRIIPLAMPAALQVTLSLLVVAAMGALALLVLRVAQDDEGGGVDVS